MAKRTIKINRAPVLTLWAAVVAERQGHDRQAALTLGKAVAGLNAQSKGRRLGLYEEAAKPKPGEAKPRPPKGTVRVAVLGREVPAVRTAEGLRATAKGEPIKPASVERYLAQRFGEDLEPVRSAMERLAKAYSPEDLASQAYALYEHFRPTVPEGVRGWGARGELDLSRLRPPR
jgi:hypothetical protein